MGRFFLFLLLVGAVMGQTSVAPLAPWAIACVSLASVGCAAGLALLVGGLVLRVRGKRVSWELVASGTTLLVLGGVTLVTALVLSFSAPAAPGQDLYSGTQVVVINVYAQPTPAPGVPPQLMADVRLVGGTVRSVFVAPSSGPVASGQAGYIDFQGQLRVYPPGHGYSPYYYYGYGYGAFIAMFFIVLFFSSFLMCFCFFPEPAPVKYVEVSPPEKRKEDNFYEPPIVAQKEAKEPV